MINFKNILLMCVLCCLLILSASNIAGTLYCNSYCEGGSGWSGGGGGTPPDCDSYVSTRTLGSCAGPGEDGETCYENSMTTKHVKSYMLDGPSVLERADCAAGHVNCCHTTQPCPDSCDTAFDDCINGYSECLVITNDYITPQDGCNG